MDDRWRDAAATALCGEPDHDRLDGTEPVDALAVAVAFDPTGPTGSGDRVDAGNLHDRTH